MMGCKANITANSFPKQGKWKGMKAKICFHYDTERQIDAICVRDDREDPFVTIFKLDDGRYVLATECQHSFPTIDESQN